MRTYNKELEIIASDILEQNAEATGNENKPNYTNREFMNCLIIFQTALMDKMYDNQEYDKMSIEDRSNMATQCGLDLRKLIHTYTGLDTHNFEEFERSSGYAGYRNKKTGEWIYEEDYFRRQKTKTVEEELLEQIKFCLYCNNEAQAIRMLEQYKYYIENEIRKTNNLL
jgi:hypothetical protein